MNISFIIITNGKKSRSIVNQILSIDRNFRNSKSDDYEVILSGETEKHENSFKTNGLNIFNSELLISKLVFNRDSDAASTGNLSKMRNGAAEKSSMDYLVVSDDDIIFSDTWLQDLKETGNFDILTPRVFSPDGTRFWDHACYLSPTKGHRMLNPDEEDDYLYMSGGTGWIMKKEVWGSFKWDESFTIYSSLNEKLKEGEEKHNEDTDFSKRCREKYKISHNPNLIVFHDDPRYTSIGRSCNKRAFAKNKNWCQSLKCFPDQVLANVAITLFNMKLHGEAADLVRTFEDGNPNCQTVLLDMEQKLGGKLEGSTFKKL